MDAGPSRPNASAPRTPSQSASHPPRSQSSAKRRRVDRTPRQVLAHEQERLQQSAAKERGAGGGGESSLDVDDEGTMGGTAGLGAGGRRRSLARENKMMTPSQYLNRLATGGSTSSSTASEDLCLLLTPRDQQTSPLQRPNQNQYFVPTPPSPRTHPCPSPSLTAHPSLSPNKPPPDLPLPDPLPAVRATTTSSRNSYGLQRGGKRKRRRRLSILSKRNAPSPAGAKGPA